MQNIEDKAVFITGGASGIGFGMARAFAECGARVAIADIRADHIENARDALSGLGTFHFVQLDITDRAAFAAAADEAEAVLGPVSILCNNAGVGMLGSIKDTAPADWDWVLGVNVTGVTNGIGTFLPRLLERGQGGHIVNTSSIGGILPGPGGAAYLASKAAIIGLSEAAYCDLRNDGIGVTVVIPGPTATNIHQVGKLRPARFAETGLAEVEAALAQTPLIMGGLDPLESGRMVVKAVRADQLYLFTHPEFRHAVQQRFDAVMSAFGPDDDAPPASHSYGFPTFNPVFADIIAAARTA